MPPVALNTQTTRQDAQTNIQTAQPHISRWIGAKLAGSSLALWSHVLSTAPLRRTAERAQSVTVVDRGCSRMPAWMRMGAPDEAQCSSGKVFAHASGGSDVARRAALFHRSDL